MYPRYYPFFDDFNEVLAAFLKSVANGYYSLKSGHRGHVRAVFQRVDSARSKAAWMYSENILVL